MQEQIQEKLTTEWSFLHRAFYEIVKFIIPRFTRSYFRFEVNGLDFIKNFPEGTPVIFCSNHRSHLDAILFASAVVKPFGNRFTCGLMASGKAMSENRFFGLVKYLGAFPVYNENPEPALNIALKYLKSRLAVFLAPQGKRVLSTPFHDYFNLIKEGKTGIGRLVLLTNGKIPVIPMYIHGSAEALKYGKILPKFKAFISLSFCKPLFFKQYTRKSEWKPDDPEFFSKARDIVDKIMLSIRDKMLIQEKEYFDFIEKKFGTQIHRIKNKKQYKKKFEKLLFKLLTFHPNDLKHLNMKLTKFNP